MGGKDPDPPFDPVAAMADLNRAGLEQMQQFVRQQLADPIYGRRDFDATGDYGQKMANDWPMLMFDPAKQFEYAERFGRAWMALWTGWLAQSTGQGGGDLDPRPYDIFLSHSKRDETHIRAIEHDFKRNG